MTMYKKELLEKIEVMDEMELRRLFWFATVLLAEKEKLKSKNSDEIK